MDRARDWQMRRADAEARVSEALAVAQPKLRDGNPHDPELVSAARKAEAQLIGGMLRKTLRQEVERLLADLTVLEKVEQIQLGQAVVKDGHFDKAGADPEYALAFREYGIDVPALSVQETAAKIRDRTIWLHLAGALDDWAQVREKASRSDWKHLLEVAGEVDSDPWRCAIRAARASGRKDDLKRLLNSGTIPELSLATLHFFGSMRPHELGDATASVTAVLRTGQWRHPADFWINHDLAVFLQTAKPYRIEEAIGFYRAATALRPQSPGVHLNLGRALERKGHSPSEKACLDEAVTCFRQAIRLKSDYAEAYGNLGHALRLQGNSSEAEANYRRVLQLKPDHGLAHHELAGLLLVSGRRDEAVAHFQKAFDLQPDDPQAWSDFGMALRDLKMLPEAEALARKAVQRWPEHALGWQSLGAALGDQVTEDGDGKLPETVAVLRKAIALDPEFGFAHFDLGKALLRQNQPEEGETEIRKAIALEPGFLITYAELGRLLMRQRKFSDAVTIFRTAGERAPQNADWPCRVGLALVLGGQTHQAEPYFREAIRLRPNFPEAHCNLGAALQAQGRFAESLAEYRRGHELGSQRPDWEYPQTADWVRQAERLLALEENLPKLLSGEAAVTDADDQIALAYCCINKQSYTAATRFFEGAFTGNPELAERRLPPLHRYNAATCAAAAAAGDGVDATQLENTKRSRLRGQALEWLTADLAVLSKQAEKQPDSPKVRRLMKHWQQDAHFASVRDEAALAKLPEAERDAWRKLWADVAELLKRTPDPPAAAKPPPKP